MSKGGEEDIIRPSEYFHPPVGSIGSRWSEELTSRRVKDANSMGNAEAAVRQVSEEGFAGFTRLEVDDRMKDIGWMTARGRFIVASSIIMMMVLVRVAMMLEAFG